MGIFIAFLVLGVCVCIGGGAIFGYYQDISRTVPARELHSQILFVWSPFVHKRTFTPKEKKRYKKIVSVHELVQDSPWTVVLKVLWVFK